jgi:hypothetical protein
MAGRDTTRILEKGIPSKMVDFLSQDGHFAL